MAEETETEARLGLVQKYNMLIGILICSTFTGIAFWIYPFGFFFVADIYFVIGCVGGLYIIFKYRKETQSHIKTGIIAALVGSILSLLFISFIDWLIYTLFIYRIDVLLFLNYTLVLFAYYGIMFILVAIIIGYLFGNYYRKREYVEPSSPLF